MTIIRDGLQSADLDFPVAAPTLNLDFSNSQSLDERITFTRASRGSYINKNGLISIASTNEPRFDHDPITGECKGLLIEESRTNYFWGNSLVNLGSISTGTATGADGTIANKYVPSAGNVAYPAIYGSNDYVIPTELRVSGAYVDVSFSGYFASVADGLYTPDIVVQVYNTSPLGDYIYAELLPDLVSGQVLTKGFSGAEFSEILAPQITLMPFGMYKVTWTVRYTQGSTIRNVITFYVQCRKRNFLGGATGEYYADGINGFQYSCLQYEIGSFPTSYIPTTTTSVTRSADLATITGTNFSSWYNQNEGTVYMESKVPYTPVSIPASYFIIFGNNQNYRHNTGHGTSNDIQNFTQNGDYTLYWTPPDLGIIPQNTDRKFTYSYSSLNNINILSGTSNQSYIFGVKFPTDVYKSMDRLQLGRYNDSNILFLNGTIARFTYYPKALSPAQLQFLTQ